MSPLLLLISLEVHSLGLADGYRTHTNHPSTLCGPKKSGFLCHPRHSTNSPKINNRLGISTVGGYSSCGGGYFPAGPGFALFSSHYTRINHPTNALPSNTNSGTNALASGPNHRTIAHYHRPRQRSPCYGHSPTKEQLDTNPAVEGNYPLLDKIDSPEDLKKLDEAQLPDLCHQIRAFLGRVVGQVGGHFSSALGVVELGVALHYVFDSPFDPIIWDIGHNSHVHKILTGRRQLIGTMKRSGGLSGYCRRYESEHDLFGAGHSSTSISSLQGLLVGSTITNSSTNSSGNSTNSSTNSSGNSTNSSTSSSGTIGSTDGTRGVGRERVGICIIGDGGMTGGMAYEALNYAIALKTPMVIVYNDNDQVSLPTGFNSATGSGPIKPFFMTHPHPFTATSTASSTNGSSLGGLNVVGPFDGHDVLSLVQLFRNIRVAPSTSSNSTTASSTTTTTSSSSTSGLSVFLGDREFAGPLVIHLRTVKGFGCPEALGRLDRMHQIKPETELTIVGNREFRDFLESGGRVREVAQQSNGAETFSQVFGNWLLRMAPVDHNIVAITAAMPGGTGVGAFADRYPRRAFDVGICEQHAVTFAAGLALTSLKPYCVLYSTFLQRAVDQFIHDVALQNLPVRLIVDRAGFVGEDGLTHHGNYDLPLFRMFRNVVTMSPSDDVELIGMLTSSLSIEGPCVIRYPKESSSPVEGRYSRDFYEYVKGYRFLPFYATTTSTTTSTTTFSSGPNDPNNYSLVGTTTTSSSSSSSGIGVSGEFESLLGELKTFRSRVVASGRDVAVLTLGPILKDVLRAVPLVTNGSSGSSFEPTVIDMRFLNPLDTAIFSALLGTHRYIVTVEEGVSGGLGTAVLEHLNEARLLSHFQVLTIRHPYEFVHHASRREQKRSAGIDAQGIADQIAHFLSTRGSN